MTTETQIKHTPGPWKVGNHGYGLAVYEVENGYKIAVAEQWKSKSDKGVDLSEESEANARLIAAAPELLEACKAALGNGDAKGDYGHVIGLLSHAIDKAEGVSHE